MISGTFHPAAQEWRYYSREKSLIHTLHLSELPSSLPGDTVLIASTAPTQNQSTVGGGIGPMALPPAPFFQGNYTYITNTSFTVDCYGSINYLGQILAQKNMTINVVSLGGGLAEVDMIPSESGFFVVHVEASTDLHTLGYQGVADDGQITVQIIANGIQAAQATSRCRMEGGNWTLAHNYLNSIIRASTECLTPSGQFKGIGFNLGNIANGARFAMWAYKMANYD